MEQNTFKKFVLAVLASVVSVYIGYALEPYVKPLLTYSGRDKLKGPPREQKFDEPNIESTEQIVEFSNPPKDTINEFVATFYWQEASKEVIPKFEGIAYPNYGNYTTALYIAYEFKNLEGTAWVKNALKETYLTDYKRRKYNFINESGDYNEKQNFFKRLISSDKHDYYRLNPSVAFRTTWYFERDGEFDKFSTPLKIFHHNSKLFFEITKLKPDKAILGKWKAKEYSEDFNEMKFGENGTVIFVQKGKNISGEYRIVNDSHLTILYSSTEYFEKTYEFEFYFHNGLILSYQETKSYYNNYGNIEGRTYNNRIEYEGQKL